MLLWAAAQWLKPETRFVDASAEQVGLSLTASYKVDGKVPDGAAPVLALHDADRKLVFSSRYAIKAVPWQGSIPLKDLREGDYQLTGEIVVGNDTIGLVPQTVSIAKGVSDWLKQVEAGLKGLGDKPKDTQRATIADHLALRKSLWAKESPETNYPAAHLLAETEDGEGRVRWHSVLRRGQAGRVLARRWPTRKAACRCD